MNTCSFTIDFKKISACSKVLWSIMRSQLWESFMMVWRRRRRQQQQQQHEHAL